MEDILNLRYALDTFYFLVSGALVMWMAAGFAMLEAGLVRAKNTAEILTKNVALFAIASIMYMVMGYNIMYPADGNGARYRSRFRSAGRHRGYRYGRRQRDDIAVLRSCWTNGA